MRQDLAPSQGYAPIQFRRNLPAGPLAARWYLIGTLGIMTWGFYMYGQGVRERNELAREKIWARMYLTPMLQAEEDRDQVRRYLADREREKALLGREYRVYNSDRFVRPTFAVTPEPGNPGLRSIN